MPVNALFLIVYWAYSGSRFPVPIKKISQNGF